MRYTMNYFLLLHIFKQLVSMQGEGSLDSSRLKAFQNKSQVGCICMLCFCSEKDVIQNKFSVFYRLVFL